METLRTEPAKVHRELVIKMETLVICFRRIGLVFF